MGLTPRHPDAPDVVRWQQQTRNGEIPLRDLARIEPLMMDTDLNGPAMMYPPAARACTDMLAHARRDGRIIRVRFSYRTLAVQRVKWATFVGPDGTPDTDDDGTRAAAVGTSNHGEALALDLTDLGASDTEWLVRHAWEYRFDNGDVNDEPWHWTYRGGYEGSEDDMAYEQFRKGVKAANQATPGDDPPANADEDFAFGWRMEMRGTTLPRPSKGDTFLHRHTVKILGKLFHTSNPVDPEPPAP